MNSLFEPIMNKAPTKKPSKIEITVRTKPPEKISRITCGIVLSALFISLMRSLQPLACRDLL